MRQLPAAPSDDPAGLFRAIVDMRVERIKLEELVHHGSPQEALAAVLQLVPIDHTIAALEARARATPVVWVTV